MTFPWAWLVLVALAAVSVPQISSVGTMDLLSGRYIDDDDDNGWSNDNKVDEMDNPPKQPCPEQCACYSQPYATTRIPSPLLTVNCSSKGLVGFPASVPSWTQVLDMSHNKLINITSLPVLLDLRLLDMSSNWMRVLDNQWVFEHVTKLRVLR